MSKSSSGGATEKPDRDEIAQRHWEARRKKILKKHGLWEEYGEDGEDE